MQLKGRHRNNRNARDEQTQLRPIWILESFKQVEPRDLDKTLGSAKRTGSSLAI